MKTKLLLLLIAAAMLCGCDPTGDRPAYYTFVNDTDKTIAITLYERNYVEEFWMTIDGGGAVPDDPIYGFTIAPGEEFTKVVPPAVNSFGKDNILDPFDDIKASCAYVSNGEVFRAYSYQGAFFNQTFYEVTRDIKEAKLLRYVFTDEFFESGYPIIIPE